MLADHPTPGQPVDAAAVLDPNDPVEPRVPLINGWTEDRLLVGHQPFLGQLLGDSLVQRFNRQLKQQIEPPDPTFTAADVDAVVEDSRFYLNGHVYFNGIWAQAGEAPPGQRALLKILADCGDGLDQNAWWDKSSLDPAAFEAALDALERHDVVNCQNGTCRYSVELMRRWVAGHAAAQ
mgnify:CR=1 FL=1